MKTLPAGLGVGDSDWQVFIQPAAATPEHLSIPAQEHDVVLAFLTALQGDFVTRPSDMALPFLRYIRYTVDATPS